MLPDPPTVYCSTRFVTANDLKTHQFHHIGDVTLETWTLDSYHHEYRLLLRKHDSMSHFLKENYGHSMSVLQTAFLKNPFKLGFLKWIGLICQ